MNGMGVSLLRIEEIGIWESMGSSNYSKRSNWAKLEIWVFHGLLDIWVDLEVMLGGRNTVKVIHWVESYLRSSLIAKWHGGRGLQNLDILLYFVLGV